MDQVDVTRPLFTTIWHQQYVCKVTKWQQLHGQELLHHYAVMEALYKVCLNYQCLCLIPAVATCFQLLIEDETPWCHYIYIIMRQTRMSNGMDTTCMFGGAVFLYDFTQLSSSSGAT